jgi:hypothetical protein
MKRIPMIGLIISGVLFSSMGHAEGIGVGAKVGTLGFGIEVTKGFTPTINGRIGFNTFSFDASGTESDIDYDADLNMESVAALVDWHPFSGGFRATAGLLLNNNELEMTAKSAVSYDVAGTTYTPAQIGTFGGTVGFDDVAPYAGIGWGNAVDKGQRLTFAVDVGVLMQGSPQVDFTSTGGLLSSDPTLLADIQAEEDELESSLDDYDLYPVISLGLAFQF